MSFNPFLRHHGHIFGLYYNVTTNGRLQKTFLPQVDLQAHATILATTSRTVLTQTFLNSSTQKGIRQVRYAFPLYDGVSVVGFTCHIGDRVIVGQVKEKEKARAVFREAVAKGQTAGLFEQLPEASDVFTTTVGNIPPGAKVTVKITYLGELKHDMEVDGIRFTIPNIICPRYGDYPGDLQWNSAVNAVGGGISITVDAEMADGSFIQKIQSPTHPISMTMGTTSLAPDAEPMMTRASATLTLGTAELDKDFVLQVIAKNTGVPKAILENHPTIPNHRALMATLVPKFSLPAEKPELVFVCDRSGSMANSRMKSMVQALKVFLKSLPVGVKFNICSFGSSHSFLWPKSVTYSQATLDEAVCHADTFTANYGGTEMLTPLKATIEQRYNDMPLDVMLLTDGEVWNHGDLFSYLNESMAETVAKNKAPIRLFTLGIGNGVSHALIEGIAKAGNGFSQTVGEGEKMDTKVVRMLKGALSPHIHNYTMDVKYANAMLDEEDEDFEIIEKVTDGLKVKLNLDGDKDIKSAVKKPISLFDTSANTDEEEPSISDEIGEGRYAHLPSIVSPKIIQAPQSIPSLFAFNRTTVYLLLGPDAPQTTPKSVVLRGTSIHGPLELEIPIQVLEIPSETIHQLAAKKAISELEQGRGWLSEAKDESGALLKTKCEGRFDEMVEREAVRLGVQFQVGGKWCSFVAVEPNKLPEEEKKREEEDWEWLDDAGQSSTNTTNTRAHSKSNKISWGPSRAKLANYHATRDEEMEEEDEESDDIPSDSYLCQEASGFEPDESESEDATSCRAPRFLRGSSSDEDDAVHDKAGIKYLNSDDFRKFKVSHQKMSTTPSTQTAASSLFGNIVQRGKAFSNTLGLTQKTDEDVTDVSMQPQQAQQIMNMSQMMQQQQQQRQQFVGASQLFGQTFNRPPPLGPGGQSLPDYQQGLMVLEQQNKRRLMMTRQEPADTNSGAVQAPFGAQSLSSPTPNYNSSALMSHSVDQTSKRKMAQNHAPTPPPPQSSVQYFGGFSEVSAIKFGSAAPAMMSAANTTLGSIKAAPKTPEELTQYLISLQTFEGFWEVSPALFEALGIKDQVFQSVCADTGLSATVVITAIAVLVFERRLRAFQGSWELVVDKAKGWLGGEGVNDVEDLVERVKVLVDLSG